MLALTIGALTYAGPAMAPARPALRAVSPVMDSDRGNYGYTNDVSKPGEFFPSDAAELLPGACPVRLCYACLTCNAWPPVLLTEPALRPVHLW